MAPRLRSKLPFAGVLFLLVGIDQLTKYLATVFLSGGRDVTVWEGVFCLRYLQNESAAFGLDPVSFLQDRFSFSFFIRHPQALIFCRMFFFIAPALIVIVLLTVVFIRIPGNRHFLPAGLFITAFVAGTIGNLIDRIRCRYVVDFLYFKLIDFPVFNVADVCVTVSAAALVFLGIFFYRDADYQILFPPKEKHDP